MKVKMLVGRAGPEVDDSPGDIVEMSSEEAAIRIKNGEAEPVKSTETEKAVLGETKTNKRTRKRSS